MLVEGYGSFSQLDADAFRRFHEHVLGLSLSDSTKTHILQAVLYLWRERDRMPEGERLTIVPWNNRSSYRLLGRWAVKKAYLIREVLEITAPLRCRAPRHAFFGYARRA
jgi:hypothetical protein